MNLLQQAGAQPNKQNKYVPLFIDRAWTGIWTQRSVLHDPSDISTARFYGGRPDAIWMGSNIELTNRLTLQRRPGLTPLSTSMYPTPPDRAFSFQLTNGTIQLIVDTGSTGPISLSSVSNVSGVAYYFFTNPVPCAANNAYVGLIFQITGFDNGLNDGTYVCIASTSTYIILNNANAVNGTHFATAISAGAVYYDGAATNVTYDFSIVENFLSDINNFTTMPGQDSITVINSGLAQPIIANASCGAYYSSMIWPNDQISSITIVSLDANGFTGPVVRASSTIQDFYYARLTGPLGSSQTQTLFVSINGNLIALGTFISTVNVNDVWTLKVNGGLTSNTLTVFQNGVSVFTFVDAVYSSQVVSGSPGFIEYNSANAFNTQISNFFAAGIEQLLFAKNPGAGQTYFVAVAGVLYMGDGADTRKYVPNVANIDTGVSLFASGQVWNWGIVPPVDPPMVTIVASGSAASAWAAHTVFSTMGLLVDQNGNTQQLYSVNGLGNNPPPAVLGTSGAGTPDFNTATGATTVDGSVVWTSVGPITLWMPNTLYQPDQAIYDPTTNSIFIMSHSTSRTSGNTKPPFNTSNIMNPNSGAHITDTNNNGVGGGNARWESVGVVNVEPTGVLVWAPTRHFNQWTLASSGSDPSNIDSAIVFPLIPNATNLAAYAAGTGPAIYLIVATTAGTTSASTYNPWTGIPATGPGSQTSGSVTNDNELQWLCLGSATWTATTSVTAFTVPGQPFSCIFDGTNMQVCVVGGTTGTVTPTWGTYYGASITEETGTGVQWVCVGPPVAWAANTQWQLPLVGFVPPSKAQPFGGSEVVGSGYVQAVTTSGKSGATVPTWNTTPLRVTTADGTIIWTSVAAYSQYSLAWTKGYAYAYSYESRLATDFYNTNPPPGLQATYPNGLGVPTGSESGAISTASPAFVITGPNTGAVNTVSGIGSTDPQVDTIVIWRSADGGGIDNMFFLTEIPAPPPIAGVAQVWSFQDYLPDIATTVGAITFPGLNTLEPAPIDDENDPPLSNFLPMVYNFQRIWGASGSNVLWSGGPDTLVGNPQENFNPADVFPYLAPVTRIVKNSQGLVIFLTDSIEFIGGGPLTSSFYTVSLAPGIGLLSYNALDLYAGEIYFLSSDSELKIINPSLQLANAGFPIGDQIANMDASTAYVAVQQAGVDNAIYLADGSTGWWRNNPHQVPANEPVWSPFATITNGAHLVESVEIEPGIKKLIVGSSILNSGSSSTVVSGVIPSVNLLTAGTYGVLAGSSVTNVPPTIINGNLGLSPGSSVTGAPTVTGNTNIDNPAAVQAQNDLTTAYISAASLSSTTIATALDGVTLSPGVYSSLSGTFTLGVGQTLTLNGAGNYVFQTATTVITGTSSRIVGINGAEASNVFWQVGSSATLGSSSIFTGTILALTSITAGSGATVNGALLARNGAVTLNNNIVVVPSRSGQTINTIGGSEPFVSCYNLLYRNLNVWTDVNVEFDAYFVIGSITLAQPGQLALLKFVEMDMSGVNFKPTVSYLLNEIAGTFTPFTLPPQADPPSIYGVGTGPYGMPQSYSPNRYYFAGTGNLARCRHLQIKVDLGKTSNGDEIYNLTVFGQLMIEL